ncbi:hypothetical protein LWC33_34510 [Pseudonocardia sp. RS11V-5]|uniref:hypothetical protein n=1 Tax=Pseudonocardia terrae TaxID=2905831 RepID=UPI001E305775|nr:hypothetical protein [Pseudonocardia terrae]MCE3556539.1 hypothetical protein [Pseudonocardia terrae]
MLAPSRCRSLTNIRSRTVATPGHLEGLERDAPIEIILDAAGRDEVLHTRLPAAAAHPGSPELCAASPSPPLSRADTWWPSSTALTTSSTRSRDMIERHPDLVARRRHRDPRPGARCASPGCDRLGEQTWSRQDEASKSLAKIPRTAVKSCHGVGESPPHLVRWLLMGGDTAEHPADRALSAATEPANDERTDHETS